MENSFFKENNVYIYKITNILNSKIYISKCENIVNNSLNYFGSGKLIKRAIQKYGKENFKKEILQECKNRKEINKQEKYWIKFYDSTNLEKGYNLTKGGDGGNTYYVIKLNNPKRYEKICKQQSIKRKEYLSKNPKNNPQFEKKQSKETIEKRVKKIKGQKRTKEFCKQQSLRRIGMKFTEEHCKNIGISKLGNCFNKGKHHTEEAKEKNRLAHLGKKLSEETKKKLSLKKYLTWAKKKNNIKRIKEIELELKNLTNEK